MNRIEPIPRFGDWNYRYFSHPTERNEPFIDFAHECSSVAQSEPAARKKQSPKELKPALTESFDAADGHLGNDRRRAGFGESIDATIDPIQEPIGRNSIQQIVADVGYESGGGKRRAILQILPKAQGKIPEIFLPRNEDSCPNDLPWPIATIISTGSDQVWRTVATTVGNERVRLLAPNRTTRRVGVIAFN